MGALFSKKAADSSGSARLQPNPNSQYPSDLSSYEAACRLDSDLKNFDATLQQRTSRVINSLAVGVEVRSLSFDSLKEVTGCLLEMNQEVVNVILECKEDIWKTPELFRLVEDYFQNSLHTLDFCTALQKCLTRARDTQLIIHVAIQRFEEEMAEGANENGNGDGKYSRTLHELRNFKAAGNPFPEEFFRMLESVNTHQKSMLEKLKLRKRKLDKKLKSLKSWRRVSNIIFVAALVTVLICSVVAAAVTAPPVLTALAAAAAVPLGSMGKWFNLLWKRYEDEVRGQKEIISSMQVGTYIAIKDLDTIRVLVRKFEVEIESLLQSANFATREEDAAAVKLAVDEIKKKLSMFMETIEDLGSHADKCSQDITKARTVVLQRIIRHPSSN